MKSTITALVLSLPLISSAQLATADPLSLDYQYQGTYPADFSGMPDGPLTIGTFEDGRDTVAPNVIQIGDDSFTLEKPLGDYINEALSQALAKAHADLSETSNTRVSGTIVEFSGRYTGSGIEIVLRCDTTLHSRNRSAWQSVLFSRVETTTDDVAEALSAALDRLARELLVDDYFRLELGIF